MALYNDSNIQDSSEYSKQVGDPNKQRLLLICLDL